MFYSYKNSNEDAQSTSRLYSEYQENVGQFFNVVSTRLSI
jgi:hypothetical protein